MATGFRIEAEDRGRYEQSVYDPNIGMDETAMRAMIISWAKKQQPDVTAAWIFVWNTPWPEKTTE
jgi:hypothetical protein